jgi:hypothetical protein
MSRISIYGFSGEYLREGGSLEFLLDPLLSNTRKRIVRKGEFSRQILEKEYLRERNRQILDI